MKILLLGEGSYSHYFLKLGLEAIGHQVTLVSDGCSWHNAPRDIDTRRNMKWGMIGGLKVLWILFKNLKRLSGYDIVQINDCQFVPLRMHWNKWILKLLIKRNRHLVKCCLGDDPLILETQARGIPRYSDTFWNGKQQHIEENRKRIAAMELPETVDCWRHASEKAEVLITCLYEYHICYETSPYKNKLHYIPLPMLIPVDGVRVKGRGEVIKVLVGIQSARDYLKGARRIAGFLEEVARRNPGKLIINYVENKPYDEYAQMLAEADVQVDQFYSFTPSMNSLTAMARGTVVIGGGEEEFYRFIGEQELRPVINVSPEYSDEQNIDILTRALLTPGNVERLSRQSIEFVRKYHDCRKVAAAYARLYEQLG